MWAGLICTKLSDQMGLIRNLLILVCVARTALAGYTRTASYQGEILVKWYGICKRQAY